MVRRKGFTIVELLVALALVVFMMAILSEAFGTAAKSFRNLKAMGDLAERLRTAASIMRRDLAADHFDGKRRLSDPYFWTLGLPAEGFFRIYQGTPSSDNIVNRNQTTNYFLEGRNLDGLPSYRASDHALHFTVKLRGNGPADFFSAKIPNNPNNKDLSQIARASWPQFYSPLLTWTGSGSVSPWNRYQDPTINMGIPPDSGGKTYTSQWAEVVYFMQQQPGGNNYVQPDGDFSSSPNNTVPLFTLYRRQQLLVPDLGTNRIVDANNYSPFYQSTAAAYPEVNINPNPPNITPSFPQISTSLPQGAFASPADVTIPWRRFGMQSPSQASIATFPSGSYLAGSNYQVQSGLSTGSDILLNDVISFEVRPLFYQTVYTPNLPPPPVPGGIFSQPNPPLDRSQVASVTSIPLAIQLGPRNSGTFLAFLPLSENNVVLFSKYQDPNQTGKPSWPRNSNFFLFRNGVQLPYVFDTWAQSPPTVEQPVDYSAYWTVNNAQVGNRGVGFNYSIPLFQNTQNPVASNQNPNAQLVLGGPPTAQQPAYLTLKAVQIVLRVWDFNTKQARQVSIIQDL